MYSCAYLTVRRIGEDLENWKGLVERTDTVDYRICRQNVLGQQQYGDQETVSCKYEWV